MNNKRLVIIGAGGFAREVKMLAEDITNHAGTEAGYEFVGFLVSDQDHAGPFDSAGEILGDFVVQVSVVGSYSSTVEIPTSTAEAPPMAYIFPFTTLVDRYILAVGISAFVIQGPSTDRLNGAMHKAKIHMSEILFFILLPFQKMLVFSYRLLIKTGNR